MSSGSFFKTANRIVYFSLHLTTSISGACNGLVRGNVTSRQLETMVSMRINSNVHVEWYKEDASTTEAAFHVPSTLSLSLEMRR